MSHLLLYNSAECLGPLVQISTRIIKANLLSFFLFGSLENRSRFNRQEARENVFWKIPLDSQFFRFFWVLCSAGNVYGLSAQSKVTNDFYGK